MEAPGQNPEGATALAVRSGGMVVSALKVGGLDGRESGNVMVGYTPWHPRRDTPETAEKGLHDEVLRSAIEAHGGFRRQ